MKDERTGMPARSVVFDDDWALFRFIRFATYLGIYIAPVNRNKVLYIIRRVLCIGVSLSIFQPVVSSDSSRRIFTNGKHIFNRLNFYSSTWTDLCSRSTLSISSSPSSAAWDSRRRLHLIIDWSIKSPGIFMPMPKKVSLFCHSLSRSINKRDGTGVELKERLDCSSFAPLELRTASELAS